MIAEGDVQFLQECRQPLDVLIGFRNERIKHRLAGTGGVETPLDAMVLEEAVETEPGMDDADRADDRTVVGIDLVCGTGEPVAAGGRDILGEGDDRKLLLVGQRPDP